MVRSVAPEPEARPNLFIVGAAKCATTYLHWLLASHPRACMSSVKEPHFFSQTYTGDDRYGTDRVNTLEEYLALFEHGTQARVIGEASPSYMFDSRSAARIAAFNPEARIVMSLRDPVARMYSHYLMDVRSGRQDLPFAEVLRQDRQIEPKLWNSASHLYFELSWYAGQVRRFLDVFPADQVLALETGDVQADGRATATVLAEFLDIPKSEFTTTRPDAAERNANAQLKGGRLGATALESRAVRSLGRGVFRSQRARRRLRQSLSVPASAPPIDPVMEARLAEYFADDVAALRAMLGAELPSLSATMDRVLV